MKNGKNHVYKGNLLTVFTGIAHCYSENLIVIKGKTGICGDVLNKLTNYKLLRSSFSLNA